MTSTTFFIIFIPILAILLLAINLILAPHNPYQEKDSVFECGFHSFLGQNRTQFSVSFFIFGLLFLLFDLEILLVYPYSVSSYTNDIYGLVIMMMFFLLLTLGFIFELGKNALTIDSRQTSYNNGDLSTPHAFVSSPKPHAFTSLPSQSSIIDDVDSFESAAFETPNVDTLTSLGGNTPKGIRNIADQQLTKLKEDKQQLLDRIKEEEENNKIPTNMADQLKDKVNSAANIAKEDLKETSNTAVECIDDSSDTEDLLFNFLPVIFVVEVPFIRILSVVYTLYKLGLFSIFYNK